MTKNEVLQHLTKLYDVCENESSYHDDGWAAIAEAISVAEDVAHTEIKWDEKNKNGQIVGS